MRLLLLFWLVWFLPVGGVRAQVTPDAPTVEASLAAEGMFRAVNLQFEIGSSTLLPHTVPVLDSVAEVLERYPWLRLEIAGHTDATGSATLNMRLSEERARAVGEYLIVRHGTDADRLEAVGYGSNVPLASNDSPTGRALNRRVEFRVISPDGVPSQPADSVSLDRPEQVDTANVSIDRPEQIDPDSARAALQRQVEEAVRAVLVPSDPDSAVYDSLAAREQELQDRLAVIERELDDDTVATEEPLPTSFRFGLLPFAGTYLRGDAPAVIGIRFDVPTELLGSANFQPDLALGFRPDDTFTMMNANIVFPIRIEAYSAVLPFIGGGVGFHNIDAFESVLNLVVGIEYRFDFGVLFGEWMNQDFTDFNRVIVGFRQDF